MIDKYHEPILDFITKKKRAVGVNEIANATGIAVSTVQKYLTTQQKYFRKTENRKWDIPERVIVDVTDDAVHSAVGVLENTINMFQSQLDEIKTAAENMYIPLSMLKRVAVTQVQPPVAEVDSGASPLIKELDKKINAVKATLDENVNKAPKDYQELLANFDLTRAVIDLGLLYIRNTVLPELTSLLLKQSDSLSDNVMDVITEYQYVARSATNF